MPVLVQVRRGTNAERLTITLAQGEPAWTTDTLRFYVGDGTTAGGVAVAMQSDLASYQPLDSDLAAVAGLSTTGLMARTGAGTAATRTITGPAAGLSVTNGNGVSGNPTLALANDLAAVEGLSGTGLAVRTASDTWTSRAIAGTAGHVTVTNGDGVAGAPTLSLPATITPDLTFSGQQTFTQPILASPGSSANPSIVSSGATTTGISWSGATMTFSIAGSSALGVTAGTGNVFNFGNNSLLILRRANGTEASPSQVLNGETIGEYRFGGYHGGGAYDTQVAALRATAREDYVGSTNTGTSLEFLTTAVGSGAAGARWRINHGGQLCAGDVDAITGVTSATITPVLQAASTGTAGSSILSARFNVDTNGARIYGAKSKVSTVGAYTATASGDELLAISGQGVDTTATNFREAARVRILQDAAGGASAVPGRISLETSTSGGTITEALRVDSAQQVQHLATTASTSTTTGCSTFAGGIGVAGTSYFGGDVVASNALAVDNAAGTLRSLMFRTAGVNRWLIRTNSATESGSDAGSNLEINARNDAGSPIDTVVTITRAAGGSIAVARPISSSSSIASTSQTAGIGYATGAGGTVTQITSRTTGVTLNRVCGSITLVSAAGSATFASFTLTNSAIAIGDVVMVTQRSGTDLYEIHVTNTAAGTCQITFRTTGGTTTETPVFNFAVIKAVTA